MYKAFSVPRDAFVYVTVLTAVTAAVVVQRILLTVVFVTATHRAHTNILFDRSVPRMEQLSITCQFRFGSCISPYRNTLEATR